MNAFRLPIAPMLDPATRGLLIDHAGSALEWSLASLAAKDRRGDPPFEWRFEFGSWLGRLIAFLPAAEINALVIAWVDAAERRAADEIMDVVIMSFMIDRMLGKDPIDAPRHERGMAVSTLFCGIVGEIVCGIEIDWPNLDAVLPVLRCAVDAFATEQTAFAATIALLRADWIAFCLIPVSAGSFVSRALARRSLGSGPTPRTASGSSCCSAT